VDGLLKAWLVAGHITQIEVQDDFLSLGQLHNLFAVFEDLKTNLNSFEKDEILNK